MFAKYCPNRLFAQVVMALLEVTLRMYKSKRTQWFVIIIYTYKNSEIYPNLRIGRYFLRAACVYMNNAYIHIYNYTWILLVMCIHIRLAFFLFAVHGYLSNIPKSVSHSVSPSVRPSVMTVVKGIR